MGNSNIKQKYVAIDDRDLYGHDEHVRQFLALNYSNMNRDKLFTTKDETIKWLQQFGDKPCINRIINRINDESNIITKRALYINKKDERLSFEFLFYHKIAHRNKTEFFSLVKKVRN